MKRALKGLCFLHRAYLRLNLILPIFIFRTNNWRPLTSQIQSLISSNLLDISSLVMPYIDDKSTLFSIMVSPSWEWKSFKWFSQQCLLWSPLMHYSYPQKSFQLVVFGLPCFLVASIQLNTSTIAIFLHLRNGNLWPYTL